MIKVLVNSATHKIIKNVSELDEAVRYTVFGFFWMPMQQQFRVIYNNMSPNFTVWALDTKTGIWGCFADQHDLGFDYVNEYARMFSQLPALKQKDLAALEKLEDHLCANFLELAREHIQNLYNVNIRLEPGIPDSFKIRKMQKLEIHDATKIESAVVAIVDAPIEP